MPLCIPIMNLVYNGMEFYRDMVVKGPLKHNAEQRPLQVVNSGRTFPISTTGLLALAPHSLNFWRRLGRTDYEIRLPKILTTTEQHLSTPHSVGVRKSQHNVEDSEGLGVPHLPLGRNDNHVDVSKSKPRTMGRPENVFDTARAAPFAYGVVRSCCPTTASTRPRRGQQEAPEQT